jgi:hypothetical protein
VPPFLTLALDGGEWPASHPGCFTAGERAPGTHWIGGWVGPRASLEAVEKRKILPQPEFEPWLSSLWPIAISTELSCLVSMDDD